MPAVLIHGVPDTHRVWDGVRSQLTRADVRAWDLPGFGAPRPAGFGGTKEEYVRWIIERLEAVGEPVDLVGHDWGCILTARVASLRPDLVRTWAGGNGPVSARYVWHPLAQIWQDPVAGDAFMAGLEPGPFAAQLSEGFELSLAHADEVVARVDATMRDSILRLYRSAVTVGAEWEPGLSGFSRPALVFWGAKDPACPVAIGREMAGTMRARRMAELDSNHWCVVQQPGEVAALLEEHWGAAG